MRVFSFKAFAVGVLGSSAAVLGIALAAFSGNRTVHAADSPAVLTIDYPRNGSLFPPEITAPTFLWHEDTEAATRWVVEVEFGDHTPGLHRTATGEHRHMAAIDERAANGVEIVPLTAEQAAMRTWQPDAETWATIKRHSVKAPATIRIEGYAGNSSQPVTSGSVTLSTSTDPVGAPIFYRDVPLMITPPGENGAIQPLPPSAIPLIEWKLRDIGQPESHTVMENLPTCANCHSFSRDGKTMGLDVDGPKNDKGLYAVVSTSKQMTIRNQDTIRWSAFQEDLNARTTGPAVKRFGIMSQVSPDGRYVVTSISPPAQGRKNDQEYPGFAGGLSDRLFSANYKHVDFTQVFFPTRGILAWYDRQQKRLRPLPGADDPDYVQSFAFWSPDGKYLIFSRARAIDPYPPGAEKPTYANDPREPQIQYDLYRIPFNEGRGGKAEPIAGASANGMSNNFPKVSPDGKWIVFVQNHTGLLMRPDSKLYIVPFAGGKARRLDCNLAVMNSWHTWSPNGRWLAFSTKARSPYTQLMLTHIDAEGHDTPAVLVENTTAGNRAVNIPEFVNIAQGGIENIDPQATAVYHYMTLAFNLTAKKQWADAIGQWYKALEVDPDNAEVHFLLAGSLTANNQEAEAAEEYKRACELDPKQADWYAQWASSLASTGDIPGAITKYRQSLQLAPTSAAVEAELGVALFESGQTDEGMQHMRKAAELQPGFARAHSYLGTALAKMGHLDEATTQAQTALELAPDSAEYEFNLGFIRKLAGDYESAAAAFEKSAALSDGANAICLADLAETYDKLKRYQEAVSTARQALQQASKDGDAELETELRGALRGYEMDAAGTAQR